LIKLIYFVFLLLISMEKYFSIRTTKDVVETVFEMNMMTVRICHCQYGLLYGMCKFIWRRIWWVVFVNLKTMFTTKFQPTWDFVWRYFNNIMILLLFGQDESALTKFAKFFFICSCFKYTTFDIKQSVQRLIVLLTAICFVKGFILSKKAKAKKHFKFSLRLNFRKFKCTKPKSREER